MAHVTLIRGPVVAPIDTVNQQVGTPPLSLAYLAGSLKGHGHRVTTIDALGEGVHRVARLTNIPARGIQIHGIPADEIVSRIPEDTDVVGISCMFSNEWFYSRHLINKIRLAFPDVPIIAGGEHITSESYRSMLNLPALTVCALGEGEEVINDLVDTLAAGGSLEKVAGIAYFDEQGEYRKTERRMRLRHLDEIPVPSWEGIPVENYLEEGLGNGTLGRRAMPMLASRGCPYTCTFCSSPSMWSTRWNSRSPELVVNEIKSYIERYDINHVDFNDLTTVINRNWIIEFCQLLISEKLNITWALSSGTRSEALDHEVLGYMKRAGIERITYAPESGSPRTLERIEKRVNLDKMASSIRDSVKVGIFSRANFIFGLPDQTKVEALESFRFITRLCFLGMYDIATTHFVPYPGSHLFEGLVTEGKIKIDEQYFNKFLAENVSTKVTGMRSWTKYMSDWSIPCWVVGSILYFYALQFLIRPHRLIGSLARVFKGTPITLFETLVVATYIRLFKRGVTVTREVERIESLDPPVLGKVRPQPSTDPLIIIRSGNPERVLI